MLKIFVETITHLIFQDSLKNRKFKRKACFLNVFTVILDQFNASLMNQIKIILYVSYAVNT